MLSFNERGFEELTAATGCLQKVTDHNAIVTVVKVCEHEMSITSSI